MLKFYLSGQQLNVDELYSPSIKNCITCILKRFGYYFEVMEYLGRKSQMHYSR